VAGVKRPSGMNSGVGAGVRTRRSLLALSIFSRQAVFDHMTRPQRVRGCASALRRMSISRSTLQVLMNNKIPRCIRVWSAVGPSLRHSQSALSRSGARMTPTRFQEYFFTGWPDWLRPAFMSPSEGCVAGRGRLICWSEARSVSWSHLLIRDLTAIFHESPLFTVFWCYLSRFCGDLAG
jgi:hypothetical protein